MKWLVALACVAVIVAMPAASAQAPARGWNREAAAVYLDQRMDDWFANAQKLDAGGRQTSCISCHTVVPYALVRPALRRALHVNAATAHEQRLIEETSQRVRTWTTNEPAFDFSAEPSRGTEAVLHAMILAAGSDVRDDRSSEALRLAMTEMWQAQRADGAWAWLDVGLEPFESTGAAYQGAAFAALAAGRAARVAHETDPGGRFAKLVGYLRSNFPAQNLHNRIWGLLASHAVGGVFSAAEREALVVELGRRQRDDGGWSLESLGEWHWNRTAAPFQAPGTRDLELAARSDGYATGLIVYTLQQAAVKPRSPLVSRGLEWLRGNQAPFRVGDRQWFAWRAYSLNYDREHGGSRGEPWRRLFMSDAATAFASLALLAAE